MSPSTIVVLDTADQLDSRTVLASPKTEAKVLEASVSAFDICILRPYPENAAYSYQASARELLDIDLI